MFVYVVSLSLSSIIAAEIWWIILSAGCSVPEEKMYKEKNATPLLVQPIQKYLIKNVTVVFGK